MSTLEFISSIVQSIAWPAGLTAVAWLLRHELRGLLGRIRSIDYKGARIEIGELAASVRSIDREIEASAVDDNTAVTDEPATAGEPPNHALSDFVRDLARTELDGTAILRASVVALERTIENAAIDVMKPFASGAIAQLDALVAVGVVRRDQAGLIRHALESGQRLIASGRFHTEPAREFAEVIARAIDWIEAGYERHFAR